MHYNYNYNQFTVHRALATHLLLTTDADGCIIIMDMEYGWNVVTGTKEMEVQGSTRSTSTSSMSCMY